MKKALLLLLLFLSMPIFSEPSTSQKSILDSLAQLQVINGQLIDTDNEQAITQLFERKVEVLDTLTKQLRDAKESGLPALPIRKELNVLEAKIKLNLERGNSLAAIRDQVKVAGYRASLANRRYLIYLIQSSKNYQSIASITENSQELFSQSLDVEKKLVIPEKKYEGKIPDELERNYYEFLQINHSYQDVLKYIIDNPKKIASIHWFQGFSLLSAIEYVNQFDFIQFVNYKLAPLKVDVGGVVLSFVIFCLVYYSYPFVFSFSSWLIEKYVIDNDSEHQEIIHHEVRRPARALLLFSGINLGTYALLYKTDFRASLEGLSFIIYSLLLIWLIYKIIDSVVLSQLDNLSKSNIELRKGLFNLVVQSVKVLVAIIILAYGLNYFGISLTAIMSTLGVGGLAFAMAAKDTLSNLFGGVTILIDNVFKMGDWVKVDGAEGTVVEIGLRSTTIRTFDNALITIPNSLISVSSVRNWNRRAVGRRIKMYIGVTYESNMDDIRQCVEEIRSLLKEHPKIANSKQKHDQGRMAGYKFVSKEDSQGIKSTQLVFVDRYNDFSIDILIYCFSRTVNWEEWLAVKEDILYKIAKIMEKNNLQFAYPTEVRIQRPENGGKILSQPSDLELVND